VALIVGLALVGCGGEKPRDEPEEIVATHGEDAYQTAVYAEQRSRWQARAEQGDARSQRQLGMMYYLGQGIETDYPMAHDWLSKAADQGDDVAQMTLGVMSNEGHGVPQSNVSAHMWFSLAARQGNSSASYHLEKLASKMTPEELTHAASLAEEWKPNL
jgi:TPR repeat protein